MIDNDNENPWKSSGVYKYSQVAARRIKIFYYVFLLKSKLVV